MIRLKSWMGALKTSILLGATCLMSAHGVLAQEPLSIGSKAPALDIEHWVQNGNGKFKPVKEFENGKVYVVEFWATWCGPCIASMPHLAQLQRDFADKGVQIVSISDEDLEKVESFLEREVRKTPGSDALDKAASTYRELTSAYCLTTDPDESCHDAYMRAASQNGIPCAFIVGKDQKIEWIGHPMSMDDPLQQIVDNKWNRDAFALQFKEEQELESIMNAIRMALRKGKSKDALEILDKAIGNTKTEDIKKKLGMIKIQIMLQDEKSNDQLPQAAIEAYRMFSDEPTFINMLAWTIYEKFDAGTLTDNKDLVKASRKAAEVAAEKADDSSRAAILDTASHLQFLDGDVPAAIKTQERAISLADGELKEQLVKFLEELKAK